MVNIASFATVIAPGMRCDMGISVGTVIEVKNLQNI